MNVSNLKNEVRKSGNYNDLYIMDGTDFLSTLEEFGLLLNAGYPQIGKADPLALLVNVPGSDRPLNLSKAIDGRLHYKQRQITAEFSCFEPKADWENIQLRLEKLLHGQWRWFRFRNSSTYWRGHLSVRMQRGQNKATVTISGVCNPYSYNMTAWLGNDWLWDIFNFEEDTIYTKPTEVKKL